MNKLFIQFIGLLFLLVSRGAFCAAPDTQYYVVDNAFYSSVSALCASEGARWSASNGQSFNCKSFNSSYVTLAYPCGDLTCTVDVWFRTRKWCVAANKAPDTTKPLASQCPDPVDEKKCNVASGSTVSWNQLMGHAASTTASVSDPGSRVPLPTSSPRCGFDGVPTVQKCWSVPGAMGGKDFYCSWTAVSNGSDSPSTAPVASGTGYPSDATPANANTNADAKGNCPGGTTQAGADSSGITICIGTGVNPVNGSNTSTTSPPPTTTTGSDGTKTTTSVTTSTNSDGSVTTTTTTTVVSPDGTVKTSQSTSTGPTPGGTGGKSDSSKDFCTANPGLTICQNSSVSGSCGQTACQGDAIQCATLRAAAAMQCAQQQDTDALKALPQKALGDQIMAGNDPMASQISDALKGTDVDMSRISFDQSGFLSGGSCLANRSFVVMGQLVSVDFTTVCNNIVSLRAVMMAVALIMSYLIVARSVVGS